MLKKLIVCITCLLLILCGCQSNLAASRQLTYRYASKEEGQELLLGNTEYYAGFSQNDLDYKMQQKNADMDSYLAFAKEQVQDFTDKEKKYLDEHMDKLLNHLEKNGYHLPELDEIIFIKTTMKEENDAGAYTHGTQIYISSEVIKIDMETQHNFIDIVLAHELFHCLTRCNPQFRADMYKLIHFTVVEEDYPLPSSVFEYHISNPDVEHHNSYATFRINGEDIDCFTDFVTTKHFEKKGDSFFYTSTTALVPVDGSDIYYTPEQAENFYEIFGANTDYVVDPEECLADNFSFALVYGMKGPNGNGYPNPEIIEGILNYLKK